MSEQDPTEEDPSVEWLYDKTADMWISSRQQIAIDGSMYRRMVRIKAAEMPPSDADEGEKGASDEQRGDG